MKSNKKNILPKNKKSLILLSSIGGGVALVFIVALMFWLNSPNVVIPKALGLVNRGRASYTVDAQLKRIADGNVDEFSISGESQYSEGDFELSEGIFKNGYDSKVYSKLHIFVNDESFSYNYDGIFDDLYIKADGKEFVNITADTDSELAVKYSNLNHDTYSAVKLSQLANLSSIVSDLDKIEFENFSKDSAKSKEGGTYFKAILSDEQTDNIVNRLFTKEEFNSIKNIYKVDEAYVGVVKDNNTAFSKFEIVLGGLTYPSDIADNINLVHEDYIVTFTKYSDDKSVEIKMPKDNLLSADRYDYYRTLKNYPNKSDYTIVIPLTPGTSATNRFLNNDYPEFKQKYVDTGLVSLQLAVVPAFHYSSSTPLATGYYCAAEENLELTYIDVMKAYPTTKKVAYIHETLVAYALGAIPALNDVNFTDCVMKDRYGVLAESIRDDFQSNSRLFGGDIFQSIFVKGLTGEYESVYIGTADGKTFYEQIDALINND